MCGVWKILWWILWFTNSVLNGVHACLDKEQFLAGLDPKTTLIFEAELLQFGDQTAHSEAYVRVTRIIRQPETGWHVQVGNVAHLTGIVPRPADTLNCLPRQTRGVVYLWATRNTAVSLRNAEYSLELVPGGLFSTVDDQTTGLDERQPVEQSPTQTPSMKNNLQQSKAGKLHLVTLFI
ncbi:unnamed protein product [Echinostoma caproni]|uniref:Reelin domain-containing protein n=1 Tax=Echinostoma caproni TaxID=27848 RepID=A0A183A5K6_9TREM|nr:unnamed protein product [Echinostoma caproni]